MMGLFTDFTLDDTAAVLTVVKMILVQWPDEKAPLNQGAGHVV